VFRDVKLESFSGVELSCPDVVIKRTSVFRVNVYGRIGFVSLCIVVLDE